MKNQIFQKYLVLIFILSGYRYCVCQDLHKNQWPQFRGINCSSIAQPGQKPPSDLKSIENIVWKTPIIPGASSPCIWEDNIFRTGFDNEKQQFQVMSYNRLNGHQIWIRIVQVKEIELYHASGNQADVTPETDGERIYVHFGSYGLLCYYLEGNMIWKKKILVNADKFGSGTSPILAGDCVILIVRRLFSNQRYFLALDHKSGVQVWKQPLLGAGYSIEDGSRSWHILVRTYGESTRIIHDNVLYVNAWHYLGDHEFQKEIPSMDQFLTSYHSFLEHRQRE